jgi:hypothetical protein
VLGNELGMRLRIWCRIEDYQSWGICKGVLVRVLRYERVRGFGRLDAERLLLTDNSRWFKYVARKRTSVGWILYNRC